MSTNTNNISSLTSKVSANTSSINTINTTLSTGVGDTYSYIKVFVLDSKITTVAAFIEDKCYGVSIVKDGIAIIPVSKKGIYKVKSYKEQTNGEAQSVEISNTVTITNPNSVVTITVNANAYGEDGLFGDLSFGKTTDAQFAAIVSALDEGKLTTNDLSWKVGDERTINLSAMPSIYVGESQPEQNVTFQIQNIGGITLTNGNSCRYVVGMKNCLKDEGYMNPTRTNKGSWKESARRKWCNEIFRNAIPEPIRSCFKQFKCITATEYNSNTVTTTDDYFALPAEKELLGESIFSTKAEANSLIWFGVYGNGAAKVGDVSTGAYWTRSPGRQDSNNFCYILGSGNISSVNIADDDCYISPFGCI